jgi:hypothetical protein
MVLPPCPGKLADALPALGCEFDRKRPVNAPAFSRVKGAPARWLVRMVLRPFLAVRASRALGVCILMVGLLASGLAHAQRIILLCPPETDSSLTEAFNRLRGELTMHGFEVEVQTSAEAISPENLALHADSVAAVASVSFVRGGGITTADIKISDRVTGKTTIRTIATPEGTDAASLLALRAVELLRTSLREFGPNARTPQDIVGAAPERASPSVKTWAEAQSPSAVEQKPAPAAKAAATSATAAAPAAASEPEAAIASPETRPCWSLRGDFLAAALLPGAHRAYGAGVAFGFRPSSRTEMRLNLEAPWFGNDYSTPNATTTLHLVTVATDLAYAIVAARHAELQVMGGIGLTRLTTFTKTLEPWLPGLPVAWVLMPRIGLGVAVLFSSAFFWQTNFQIAALRPTAYLHVEDRRFSLGLPMFTISSGVGVRF